MVTRPAIDIKYKKIADFVSGPDAEDMPTVVEYGVIAIENMRDSTDPIMNELIAKTHQMTWEEDEWASMCFKTR